MLRKLLPAFLLLIFVSARAQILRTPLAAQYTHTNTYSSYQSDVFSFTANQGALAGIRNFSFGGFAERRFLIADLNMFEFAAAMPVSSGAFGLAGGYFGSTLLNESHLGLAYGRTLGKIDVGVQFNYNSVRAQGYGNSSAISFEAAARLHVTEQFQTGFHVNNPTRAVIGKGGAERLPSSYGWGIGYDASERLFIGAEIQKTENEPVDLNAGLQYAFEKKLFARAGISSSTSSFYLGFGFLINRLRIDATASVHPNLGMTPGLMLVYSAANKKP